VVLNIWIKVFLFFFCFFEETIWSNGDSMNFINKQVSLFIKIKAPTTRSTILSPLVKNHGIISSAYSSYILISFMNVLTINSFGCKKSKPDDFLDFLFWLQEFNLKY
jgi:hypothetical protein